MTISEKAIIISNLGWNYGGICTYAIQHDIDFTNAIMAIYEMELEKCTK